MLHSTVPSKVQSSGCQIEKSEIDRGGTMGGGSETGNPVRLSNEGAPSGQGRKGTHQRYEF